MKSKVDMCVCGKTKSTTLLLCMYVLETSKCKTPEMHGLEKAEDLQEMSQFQCNNSVSTFSMDIFIKQNLYHKML